ncbi:RIP metalloprotease RseP [Candidatus Cyanaurora vandensis]|uniref:RIP metalloprotease RseP n=1 Tax=Candidatus Cyanaurora vandensis TaxID=2714958 RepID=UPI00257FC43E|nr:RIP metalloprotease RseP [Candidatus Cyanaurora vandensis]
MGFLAGIGVLASLIIFHELGHFLAARLQGIYANRFAIGFGPVLLKYDWAGTEFSLRLLPLGGFVGFPDEDPDSTIPKDDPNLLKNRPILDRAIVMAAGVVMNLIVAYAALLALVLITGIEEPGPGLQVPGKPVPGLTTALQAGDVLRQVNGQDLGSGGLDRLPSLLQTNPATLTLVLERDGKRITQEATPEDLRGVRILGLGGVDTPAAKADIQAGDVVLQAGDQSLGLTPTESVERFRTAVQAAGQQPLILVIRRGTERINKTVTPSDKGQVGVSLAPNLVPNVVRRPVEGVGESLAAANQKFFFITESTLSGFGQLFTGKVGLDQLSSPVGIVKYTADVSNDNPLNLLSVAALVSFSLAFLNLLPIPGLDGSHLVFLALEAIRGKPVSEQIQNRVLQTGLIFLMGLSVTLILKDSLNWILKGSPF